MQRYLTLQTTVRQTPNCVFESAASAIPPHPRAVESARGAWAAQLAPAAASMRWARSAPEAAIIARGAATQQSRRDCFFVFALTGEAGADRGCDDRRAAGGAGRRANEC